MSKHTSRQTLYGGIKTITLTGTQNDVDFSQVALLRCDNASDLTITGFKSGFPGQMLTVISVGAGNVFFSYQTGSSAANQLTLFATVGQTPLAAGAGVALFRYDSVLAKWRLETHDQGNALTPAFAAGNYTGNGAMTWTVAAGDVVQEWSYLRGRTLMVGFHYLATTIAGVVDTTLIRAPIPGGFTAARDSQQPIVVIDNTVPSAKFGKAFVVSGGTQLNFRNDAGAVNWTAGVDLIGVFGVLNLTVQ